MLISDVSKTFDILGWFSPTIIKVKILFQRLWELKIDWDDPVPMEIQLPWSQWRSELPILSTKLIPRCYFPHDVSIEGMQLHGFSDASENAYWAVTYFRFEDTSGNFHISLITSKTNVAPIKRLTIPRLELCGAYLLADLLSHVKEVFHIPMCDTYAWSDSTIVIDWLNGNPRRFKTFVGNRVSHILDHIPPDRWSFEEVCTFLTQIEACLNSRPLVVLPSDDDCIEALTPGHFLIGRSLEALPDPSSSYQSISILRRWHLLQAMLRHFWKRWSSEYVSSLRKYTKWHNTHRNIKIGDIVILQEGNLIPTKWPLARVINVHPGSDQVVRVVTVKTSQGTYKRPITKVALLLRTS